MWVGFYDGNMFNYNAGVNAYVIAVRGGS